MLTFSDLSLEDVTAEFNETFKQDMAAKANVSKDLVFITGLMQGSLLVQSEVHFDVSGDSTSIAANANAEAFAIITVTATVTITITIIPPVTPPIATITTIFSINNNWRGFRYHFDYNR
ncbi:hypothetical protein CYMTET_46091 [Cymbomonas tetramitiformis]|nr:hypothetical protein CYMTET_46091 [Cymbomonas tetramitiformis]